MDNYSKNKYICYINVIYNGVKLELRDYQEKAIQEIRQIYAKGTRKILLNLPTGSGKTLCFSYMLKSCHEKGTKAIMVVRGRDLVDQASSRLTREGVPHGVLMAGHEKYDLTCSIQICSIDTLSARHLKPDASLIVIDEAHLAGSEKFRSFLAHYDKAFILGVTATPYGEADLTHIAETVVSPIGIEELIAQGYLVDARYFGAAEPIDLSDIKITKGDYNEKQLDEKMQDLKLVADVVASYKRLGENRPALCFAVSIEHSKKLAAQFVENDVAAIHLDAGSSREARLKEIARLESGEIKVICNVGIFTTGVDIPALSCIILARPTKSYNLYVQMLGRGTRCAPGKKDFLVIDHAQAVFEHGFITMPRKVVIEKTKRASGAAPIKTCKACYAICHAAAQTCTQCGEPFPIQEKSKEVNTLDIALSEIKDPIDKILRKLFMQQQKKNYAPGWVFYKLKEQYDERFARKLYYKSFIPIYFPELKK